jgi:hypothetical protein
VIAEPLGAELVTRHRPERRNRLQLPADIIEQSVVYSLRFARGGRFA